MLAGGTALGRNSAGGKLAGLTRLYGPEAFGALGVFVSLSSILGMVAALRYEFAIPLARDERGAVGLVGVANATLVAVTLATALGVWLAGDWLARTTSVPELMPLLWLLPLTVLCNGLSAALGSWSIRRGTFRRTRPTRSSRRRARPAASWASASPARDRRAWSWATASVR